MEGPSFIESPDGNRDLIMSATYRALCEYGYSGITINRIGEHFEKSKSLLYHHYDSKDELLLDFLQFILQQMQAQITETDDDRPREQLLGFSEAMFDRDDPEFFGNVIKILIELRAQATHDEAYRTHFTKSDEIVTDYVKRLLELGMEAGVVRDVAPRQTAAFITVTFLGAQTKRMTTDGDDVDTTRAEFDRYLDELVLADGYGTAD